MAIGSAVDNAAETSGDLNKEAWDKYNLLRSAVLVYHDTDGSHLSTGDVVLKALFDANTILAADADDTPAALTVAASRIIGRASTGNIAALTAAQVNTILSTATKALDNLASVAINTSLISDTDNTDDLGSAAKEWKDLYIDGTANIDVMAPYTMTGSGAKLIDISGAATTAQIYIGGTAILASDEQAIYVNCPSETTATNAVWLDLRSTVTSGDLTGIRSRVYGNAASAGANIRGGYLEAKMAAASKKAAMLEGALFHADYSPGSITVSGDVRGFTAHISQGSGLNAANLYGGLISIQTRGDETITTDDVGLMIRNEAVGGNGRTMDSGLKITDLNMGGGTNGFTYGIDLNGVGIATADIRFSGGQVITSSASALTLPAFTLGGKLTAGASEIEGSAFDINGGDMTGVTISGALTWNAAQNLNSQNLTNVDINSGTIDGTTIGAGTAAAGTFVALTATGAISFDGGSFTFNTTEADLDVRFAASSITNALYIDGATGKVFINDTANAFALGPSLTIDGTGQDGEYLTLKDSTDIAHGMTTKTETDTWFTIRKIANTEGGADIWGMSEAVRAFDLVGVGTTENTTKTSNGLSFIQMVGAKKDGTTFGAPGANANIFTVQVWGVGAVFIVDAEGDLFADGGVGSTNMVTLYDDLEDAHLVRAFDVARSRGELVKGQFDKFLKYNEDKLVELGILGDTVANGGLINVTRLQQLHNGAIWQNYVNIKQLQLKYERAFEKLGISQEELLVLGAK